MALPIKSNAAKMLVWLMLGLLTLADSVYSASSTVSAPSSTTSGGPPATHTVNAGIVRTHQCHCRNTLVFQAMSLTVVLL